MVKILEERIRLINVYRMMLVRCYTESDLGYHNYGGRGIYVVDEWLYDPTAFVEWSLASGSARGLQIDRIDNDGPYGPRNCRYVTPAENTRNRRNSVIVEAFGESKNVIDWLDDERCAVENFVLYKRIADGWDAERAITTPANDYSTRKLTAFGEAKEWTEWSDDPRCQVNRRTLVARINRGWGHEAAITTPPDGTRKGKVAPNAKIITAWGESKTVAEWLDDDRCIYKSRQGIWERINKHGWDAEKALTQPPGRGRPKKS